MAGGTPGGTRSHGADAPQSGRRGAGGLARRRECSKPGPRVRRRGLYRCRRDDSLFGAPRRPLALGSARCGARASDAGGCVALRGFGNRFPSQPAPGRAGGPFRCWARAAAGPRGHFPRRRSRRSAHAAVRSRLLFQSPPESGRRAPVLAGMAPSPDALGRNGALDRSGCARRRADRKAASRRRARRIRLPAAMVAPGRAAFRVGRERFLEPVPRCRRHSCGVVPPRGRVRLAAMGLRNVHLRLYGRWRDPVRVLRERLVEPGAARPERDLAAGGDRAYADRLARRPGPERRVPGGFASGGSGVSAPRPGVRSAGGAPPLCRTA